MTTKTWTCGHGHRFIFGNETWHYEVCQGLLPDGSPIPMYCTEEFSADEADEDAGIYEGDPCSDSTSLVWE